MLFSKGFYNKDLKETVELEVQSILNFLDIYDQHQLDIFNYQNDFFSISIQKNPLNNESYRHTGGKPPMIDHFPHVMQSNAYSEKEDESENHEDHSHSSKGSEKASVNTKVIQATISGSYYPSNEPGAKPLLNIGTQVSVGQTVCLLESMKLFTEVKAEVSGVVVQIFHQEGDIVSEGDVLFELQ